VNGLLQVHQTLIEAQMLLASEYDKRVEADGLAEMFDAKQRQEPVPWEALPKYLPRITEIGDLLW
jgi:hypothetical protein